MPVSPLGTLGVFNLVWNAILSLLSTHRCLCRCREIIEESEGLVKTGFLKRNPYSLIFFIKHQHMVARNLHVHWIQTWWVTAGALVRRFAVFLDGVVFSITKCSKGNNTSCFMSFLPVKNQANIYMILPKSNFSIMNQGYHLSTVSGNTLLYSVPITFSSLEFLTYPNMPFLFIIKVEIGCFSGNPCWLPQPFKGLCSSFPIILYRLLLLSWWRQRTGPRTQSFMKPEYSLSCTKGLIGRLPPDSKLQLSSLFPYWLECKSFQKALR